jgi:hypothetical protein
MHDRLISGDNHIDLTYCPPDLWSSQAPAKCKLLVPRVEELEDGLHWFVEGSVDQRGSKPGWQPSVVEPSSPKVRSAAMRAVWKRRASARPTAAMAGPAP